MESEIVLACIFQGLHDTGLCSPVWNRIVFSQWDNIGHWSNARTVFGFWGSGISGFQLVGLGSEV